MSRVTRVRRSSGLVMVLALMVGGLVGVGPATSAAGPVMAEQSGPGVMSVSVAGSHSCVVGADRSLWCWGENRDGQLGDGTGVDSKVPVRVTAGDVDRWLSVTTSPQYTCGVAEDGSAWCWGRNWYGQLGDGSGVDSDVPVRVHTGDVDRWVSISAAQTTAIDTVHTCGVAEDGSAWCWGRNWYGQLGDGTLDASDVPVRVTAGDVDRWRSVGTSSGYTCGVAEDGSAWCWGYNRYGQLGDGTKVNSDVPVRVATDDVERWQSIDVGHQHACGVAEDGSAWCWGRNHSGQHGDGTRDDSDVPVRVADGAVDAWQSVSTFVARSCGVAEDGSAWCWGSNSGGRLGDGTGVDSDVPVRVATDDVATWRFVDNANSHSCGVAANGSVWCWGDNRHGELGDGTEEDSAVPVAMVKPEPVIALDGVPGSMVYGDTAEVSVSVEPAVAVSVSTDGACSAVEGDDGDVVLSATGTGPCAVTAETFDNGVLKVVSVTETVEVARAVAVVSVDDVSVVFDGGPQSVEVVTEPAGLDVEVTYDGDTEVPVDAGSYGVEVVVVDDHHVGSATAVLTIERASQRIDLGGVPGAMRFGDSVMFDAEADSGLPVDVSVSGVCELDGFELSAVGVGLCVVEATQGGDGNFEPAEPVTGTVEVGPAVAVVSVDDVSVVFDGGPQSVEVVTDPAGLDVEVTYDGDTEVPVDAGSYGVEVVVVDEHHVGSATAVLTIDEAPTEVQAEVDEPVLVGDPVVVEVAVSTGSGVEPTGQVRIVDAHGEVLAIAQLGESGAATVTLEGLGVGLHELAVAYDGDGNHGSATDMTQVEVVTAPRSLTGLPTEVDPGDRVAVTAAGFIPGEEVLFVLHSDPVEVARGGADAHGTVRVDFEVPDLPGAHRLVATGASSGITVEAETVITDDTPDDIPDVPAAGDEPVDPDPGAEPQDAIPAPGRDVGGSGAAPDDRGSESVEPTGSAGQLPVTGWPASGTVGVALLAIAAGMGLIVGGRRRRRHA